MIEQDISTNYTTGTQDGTRTFDASNEEIEVSLIDVLTQLALCKLLIAKVTGAFMLIGLILCFVTPVKYTATTEIMTPQQTPSSAGMMNQLLASGNGSGAGALAVLAGGGGMSSLLKDPNTLYIGLLKSRPIADAIIHKFGMDKEYRSKDMTAARENLAKNTEFTSDKTGFISISVTDMDKKRVAEIANNYTEELRNTMKTMALSEASQRRMFYEEQMSQAKNALLSAELAFQQVEQKKGLVQPDAQGKAMIESIAALRAKVAAKEVEVRALRSFSTEQSPEVQMAESQLSSLQGEAAKLEQQSHSSGFGNLGLADVPGAGLVYLRAEHDLRYQQALFDLLLKQYDAARLDEAKEAAVIQVVEPAIEPDRGSSPKRLQLVALFSTTGFFAACMLSLIIRQKAILLSNQNFERKIRDFKFALLGR